MIKQRGPKCGLKLSGLPFTLYSPAYAELTGCVKAGIMLAQAAYWQSMNPESGWWFQTQAKWAIETGLSRTEQDRCRRILRKFSFWREKLAGLPGKMHFNLNLRDLADALGCELVERGKAPVVQKKQNPYSELYKTQEWKDLRDKITQRDNHSCVQCGASNVRLNVHHLYYIAKRKPWEYQDSALITLCESCHLQRHSNPSAVEDWEKSFGGEK